MTEKISALEAEPSLKDDDDDSIGSSATSLTDSIFDYRKLHGRPYSSSATTEYWAPVDATQNEAFDLFHNVHLMVSNDKLFQAPISSDKPGLAVLDVGTGTGIWAIDFAHQYPKASVMGTDISATQPNWVPPNCRFVVEDCLLDWALPTNHFDFVHIRSLYGCVPDWAALYTKAFHHLKPGGWFEHVEREVKIESDHVAIPPDHVFNTWADLFYQGGDKMGRSFAIAGGHTMKELMEAAGFIDVHEKKIKMPMHGWPRNKTLRDAGLLAQLALDQALEGLSTFLLTQVHGWEHGEAVAFTNSFRKESRKISSCGWIWW